MSQGSFGRAHVRSSSLAIAALLATFTGAGAQAAERAQDYNAFEITPFGGYMAGGSFEDPQDENSDRDLDAGSTYGVILNAAVEEWRHYELLYVRQSSEIDGFSTFDVDVQYLQIGGTVSNPDAEHVIPYFGLTVGAAQFSPDETGLDDETALAFSVGGGLRIPVTERIGVRFDARAFITVLDSDGDIFCASGAAGGTCRIRAKGDTLLQYAAGLGVTFGF